MSFDTLPPAGALNNGAALDGRGLNSAFAILSFVARSFAADLLGGRSAWLTGGVVDDGSSPSVLRAATSPVVCYMTQHESFGGAKIDYATRGTQTDRTLDVPQNSERAIGAYPHSLEDRLTAMVALRPIDAAPDGFVLLDYIATSFEQVVTQINGRQHYAFGAAAEGSSQELRARSTWEPLTDLRCAVVLRPGDELDIRLEMNVEDEFKGSEAQKETKPTIHAFESVLEINGTVPNLDDHPEAMGPASIAPLSHTIYADLVFSVPTGLVPLNDAILADGKAATFLVQINARGLQAQVESAVMWARIRPAEQRPT